MSTGFIYNRPNGGGSGSGGGTVSQATILSASNFVRLEDYYQDGDGGDWSAAFMRAQLTQSRTPEATNGVPCSIQLGNRDYRCASTVDCIASLELIGKMSDADTPSIVEGQYGGIPRIFFVSGTAGFRIRYPGYYQGGTYGNGNLVLAANTNYGGLLSTYGVVIQGSNARSRDAHGIYAETGFNLEKTTVQYFGADGVHVETDVVGPVEGHGFCHVGLRDTQATASYSVAVSGTLFSTISAAAPTGSTILNALYNAITASQVSGAIRSQQRVKIENCIASTAYHMTVDGFRIDLTTSASNAVGLGTISTQQLAQAFVNQINGHFGASTVTRPNVDSILFTGSNSVIEIGPNMIQYGFDIVNTGSIVVPSLVSSSANLVVTFRGVSNNCYTNRLHCFNNWGNGIYIHGDDANQINLYQMDCQNNRGAGIVDNSFLGNQFYGCHVVSLSIAADSNAYMCSAGTNLYGCYTEGGVGSWLNSTCAAWGGTGMAKQPGLGGLILDAGNNALALSGAAFVGANPAGDGARLGDATVSGRVFSIYSSDPTVNDVQLQDSPGLPNVWEWIVNGQSTSNFEGVCNNVNAYNPNRKIFQKGFIYGGGNDSYQNNTPLWGLRTYQNAQYSCKMTIHDTQVILGATNASPIVISVSATNRALLSGSRVLVQNVGGNTAANGIFMVGTAIVSAFQLKNFDSTNTTGNGAFVSAQGMAYSANFECYNTGSPTVGNWANGDRCWNTNVTSSGQPIAWCCVSGGAPGTWMAYGSLA